MLLWFEKEFVFRGIGGCGPLFYFKSQSVRAGADRDFFKKLKFLKHCRMKA
jgi:hypothetical protein